MGYPGTAPNRKREDWDVIGRPNRQVAEQGPPVIRNFPPRGRGRGRARARGAFNPGSGRGGGHEATGRPGPYPIPSRPRAMMGRPRPPQTDGNGAGPSNYREARRYSPSYPVREERSYAAPPSSSKHTVFGPSPSTAQSDNGHGRIPQPAEHADHRSSVATEVAIEPRKLSFRPTLPNHGNNKGKDRIEAVKTQDLDVDVKPNLETSEEETLNVAIDDLARRDGVLAFKKDVDYIPPLCFSTKREKRESARLGFRQRNTHVLRQQGRKLTSTMWRDDGVAFTWEKIEGKGVPDPAKPGHAVAAVPEASLVQQPANSPSRPEFAQNGRTQVGESSAPDSGRVSFIPCPRHLATQEMRRAATDAMLEWMIEQWATVAEIDRSGRATRHVVLGQLNDHIGLRLQSFALPFGVEGNTRDQEMRSMAWNEKITYIPWPPELATAKLRKNLPDAYDEWKLRVWREVAKLDSSGHATKDVHFKVFPTSVRVSATPLAPDRDGHTEDRYRQTLRPLRTRSGIHQEDYSPANADDKSGLVRVPYPPEFAPRLARKTPAFAQWIDEQLEIVSNHRINDGPKRLVIPRKHDEALFINWRVRDEDVGARVLSPSMLPSRYHSTTNGSVHLQTFPSPNAERSTISPEGPPAKRVRINAPVFQQIRPPPALASASAPSAPEPESTSAILRGLETAMQSKLTAIDNWTNILADYPDRAEAIGKQVERTQGEIFQIRGQMRTEREKTRGLD